MWDSEYPWDIRVEKMNDALIEEGHKVFLVCRNLSRSPLRDTHRNAQIFRLPFLPKIFGKLNAIISFPAFFNPLWVIYSLCVAKRNNIDLIIVRDLPLSPLCIWISKMLNVPSILDMAENYPYMLESILEHNDKKWANYLVRNPTLARLLEKYVFKRLNKIFVVIEESKERLLRMGVEPSKIYVVRNTPQRSFYANKEDIPLPEEKIFKNTESLILLYNGLTNPSRGILDFVRLMPEIIKYIPHVKLIINGKGQDDYKIITEIERLGLQNKVYHKGWVSHEDKKRYLAHCDIGLIPYRITSHWNTTIPNKLFDYMCMRTPVLSTSIKPTARIINESGCGLVYNENSLTQVINKLYELDNKQTRHRMGDNGYRNIVNKYNWEIDKLSIKKCIASINS